MQTSGDPVVSPHRASSPGILDTPLALSSPKEASIPQPHARKSDVRSQAFDFVSPPGPPSLVDHLVVASDRPERGGHAISLILLNMQIAIRGHAERRDRHLYVAVVFDPLIFVTMLNLKLVDDHAPIRPNSDFHGR